MPEHEGSAGSEQYSQPYQSPDVPDRPAGAPDASRLADVEALERVLRETAASYFTEESDEEIIGRLQKVAKRHQNAVLVLEPIAVELVEVVLHERLGQAVSEPGLWRILSTIVAQTLWEDEPSRGRLERLWERLSEAVS